MSNSSQIKSEEKPKEAFEIMSEQIDAGLKEHKRSDLGLLLLPPYLVPSVLSYLNSKVLLSLEVIICTSF